MNHFTVVESEEHLPNDECEVFHACFTIIFGLPLTD